MKKTKAQREYHQQMKALNNEAADPLGVASSKKYKKRFRESKVFYYGIRIVIIIVILQVVSYFDMAFFSILDFYQ